MPKETRAREFARLGESAGHGGFFGGVFITFLLMVVLSVAVLLVGALVLARLPDATPYIRTVGCAMGGILALVGGIIAGKKQKHAGALAGLLYGALYVLMMLLCGRFLVGGTPLWWRISGYGIFLLLAVLGGALGGMRRTGHRKRRRVRA